MNPTVSKFDPEDVHTVEMYELGEQFASMVINPESWTIL